MAQRLFAKKELKAARQGKGYTQAEAVDAFILITGKKISLVYYQMVEQGLKDMSLDNALEFCRMYGVVMGDVFKSPLVIKRNGKEIA